jgi:hypothetical protein
MKWRSESVNGILTRVFSKKGNISPNYLKIFTKNQKAYALT